MITTEIENFPGFAQPVEGPWLMEQMRLQAEHVGAQLVSDYVVEAHLTEKPFRMVCDSGAVYTADSVIIATGAKAKWLGLPSEEKFKGYGVSACATCDGFFFRNKRVVVVGGGNTAVEEALYLSNIVGHVTVVHRRDAFRAERILSNRLAAQPNVSIIWDSAIDEILGGGDPPSVNAVRLRNVKTGAVETLETDGVFVAIGHHPASELFADALKLKDSGYIETAPNSTATSIPGVFAAGDVADEIYRQAVTAAGLGCMAALEAEKYLFLQGDRQS